MKKYMKRAIELAKCGVGFVNPNPLVGAVIVKDGRIIGEGYHAKYGELHAERNALKSCTESAEGADMYVTLEPCCHYGKNPPCTEAVIEAGIKHIYVGSYDPNPLVDGGGIKQLRENGIEVTENYMREECDKLNPIFFHYITQKTPYMILKLAQTLDGKIAAADGTSRWITNQASRDGVQLIRKRTAAIMTGVGTVIADNPMLNCRCENPSNPIRIICDSNLRIPLNSRVVQSAAEIPTYVVCVCDDERRRKELERLNVKIIKTSAKDGRVNIKELMRILGGMEIDSVLCEGGGEMAAALIREKTVNRIMCFIAPKLLGANSKSSVSDLGIATIGDAKELELCDIKKFDEDILLEYEVKS